ncbi:MAG: hypothetical protein WDN49_11875 [Acetobacteraceae bacterium]
MKFGQIAAPLAALATAACSTSMAPCPLPLAGDAPVYVVSRGWHVDVGIPADQLDGPLAVYRDVFPGARTVMFGFGKKTFITAPADTISEYLLGPVPGPAVIQVTALSVAPPDAYPPAPRSRYPCRQGAAKRCPPIYGTNSAKTRPAARGWCRRGAIR